MKINGGGVPERDGGDALPLLPDLRVARLAFELTALEEGTLPPYLGSTLRGALGHALKHTGCTRPTVCRRECRLPFDCAYSLFFETPIPPGMDSVEGGRFGPHPFTISPLDPGGLVLPGARAGFVLTLLGAGIRYVPLLLAAVEDMAAEGLGADRIPFEVTRVTDGLSGPPERPVFDPGTGSVLGSPEVVWLSDLVEGRTSRFERGGGDAGGGLHDLMLKFLTPIRLVKKGQHGIRPVLDILIPTIHRRLMALAQFHADDPITQDLSSREVRAQVRRLTACVGRDCGPAWDRLEWADWEKWSNRQKRNVKQGGYVGEAVYTGVPGPFLRWLLAAEWVHAGKATSLGLGALKVETCPREVLLQARRWPRLATTPRHDRPGPLSTRRRAGHHDPRRP